eukprot:TRINITY_DN2593_c6_g1_i1.p1 TRINITY_DN2593_c6_g1~~TRINITY_DN2593_c6_g1_i1.p1  ORF type:complete len:630 (+),score=76.98 TRINITY_DN2593_c6_g1_i1:124-2013(+)
MLLQISNYYIPAIIIIIMDSNSFSSGQMQHHSILEKKLSGAVLHEKHRSIISKRGSTEAAETSTEIERYKLPPHFPDSGEESVPDESVPVHIKRPKKPRLARGLSVVPSIDKIACQVPSTKAHLGKTPSRGLVAPPPVFPVRRLLSEKPEASVEDWGNTKNLVKALAKLKISEMENAELNKKCKELRKAKIEAEEIASTLKDEQQEIGRKMEEQVEWIKDQMERNYRVSGSLEEAKVLLLDYKRRLQSMKHSLKSVSQYIAKEKTGEICECSCEYGCSPIFEQVQAKLSSIISASETLEKSKIEPFIEAIVNDLSTDNTRQKEHKSITPAKIQKDPYLDMKIRIEELQDELQIASKWKTMYAELLVLRSNQAGPLELYSPLLEGDQSIYEADNTILINSLKEEDKNEGIIKDLKEEILRLEEEVKKKEENNFELASILTENKELKNTVHKLKVQLKANAQPEQKDIDETVYKLSLIILGKYKEEVFTKKDAAIIQQLFGEKIIKHLESVSEDTKSKALLSSMVSLHMITFGSTRNCNQQRMTIRNFQGTLQSWLNSLKRTRNTLLVQQDRCWPQANQWNATLQKDWRISPKDVEKLTKMSQGKQNTIQKLKTNCLNLKKTKRIFKSNKT